MSTNTTNRNKTTKSRKRPKKGKRRTKKFSLKTLVGFLIFEFIFTACTFPFVLLHGPFETAKSTYVGAAMTSKSNQWLATLFLSNESIAKILGENTVVEDNNETTNTNEIHIPTIKDNTIEFYKLAENPKYTGYYLVVKDPTRVKIGVTSKLKVEGEITSQIAENNDAIAAINGGGFTDKSSNARWTGNGGLPTGIVMTDGEVKYNDLGENKKTELFAINKEGKMIVGKYSVKELKNRGVQEALNFKPLLIVNGKKTSIKGDGGWGIAPRTAIGQRKEDGAIILLVIDGRGVSSLGATIKEVQEVMYKLGAYNALNLDGGKSTTMYYDGDVRNNPSYSMGERPIPTAVIVK